MVHRIPTGFALLSLFSISAVADPVSCDTTFTGLSEFDASNWHNPENWSGQNVPGPGDVVCITDTPGADFVYMFSDDAEARAFWVEEGAILEVYGPNTFTLFGDKTGDSTVINSYVDGQFLLCPPTQSGNGALLKLKKSISFLASGSTGERAVVLEHTSARIQAQSGSGATITIGSGVTLKGWGQIRLPIVNNGKVIGQNAGGGGPTTLTIEAGGSGAGTWAAKTDSGHLHVINTAITGPGKWELLDHASAKLEIDAACLCLTGNVEIRKGTLDVDASFLTEGNLAFGGKDSLIDVAATKSAKFSVTSGCSEQ